jgi:hypothetical protein
MSAITVTLAIVLTLLVIYLIVMVGVLSAETGTYKKIKDERTTIDETNDSLVKSIKSKFSIA